MFAPLTNEDCRQIEADEALRRRADHLIARLLNVVDTGGKGLFVFVDDYCEGAALARLIVEHFGPSSDETARVGAMLCDREPLDHERALTPGNRLFCPRVFHVTAMTDDPDASAVMRDKLVDERELPGMVFIMPRAHRALYVGGAKRELA